MAAKTIFKFSTAVQFKVDPPVLRSNVPQKRHRLGLKYFDNTFTGADAIQTLLNLVKIRPDIFPENTNRRNISRLCSKLLEQGILERVGVSDSANSNHEVSNGIKTRSQTLSYNSSNSHGMFSGSNTVHNFSSIELNQNNYNSFQVNRFLGKNSKLFRFEDNNSALYKLAIVENALNDGSHHLSPTKSNNNNNVGSNNLNSSILQDLVNHSQSFHNQKQKTEIQAADIERTCTRELVRVRLLQLLDINFIDNIVASPNTKPGQGSLLLGNDSNAGNENTSNGTSNNNSSSTSSNQGLFSSITSKFSNFSSSNQDKDKNSSKDNDTTILENIPWDPELCTKFDALVKQSTFNPNDSIVSAGLHHIHNFLIGRNRGLFNGLTDFYRQDCSHQQGINLYKLIQQYYRHCFNTYKASLINGKWSEVLQAIGRLIEQIKRIEASEQMIQRQQNGQLKNLPNPINNNCNNTSSMMGNVSLNLSVCSFSSSGTENSLRTSQKEVIEASQLFFQFLSGKNRQEMISLMNFLRTCSTASGPLSIEGIIMDYCGIFFCTNNWDTKEYCISGDGINEKFEYEKQILYLWIDNCDILGEIPEELNRQIKLKCDLRAELIYFLN